MRLLTLLCAALLFSSPSLASKPNLLLLLPDQWRSDWDSIPRPTEGKADVLPLRMPVLRSLMANGTRFEKAFVPAPVCAPSRSCLAAGREYDRAGVPCNFCNDYNTSIPTFYKLLRDHGGYHVMTTGKDDLTKDSQPGPEGKLHMGALGFSDGLRSSGKDDVINTYPLPHEPYGFYLANESVPLENGTIISAWDAHYACMKSGEGHRRALCERTSYPDVHYEDNWVTRNALTLLARKPKNTPWFLQVNFPGPHPPFLITANQSESQAHRTYPEPFDGKRGPDVCSGNDEPDNGFRCDYAAELENLDARFGEIIAMVQAQGELDNTLICVVSDHGEMLGDHGDSGKTMPWQGSVSVPLLCAGLDTKRNVTIQRSVTTMDLAGTFLEYAGVSPDKGMTTASLRGLLSGKGEYSRDYISSGLQSMPFGSSITKGGYDWRMVVKEVEGNAIKFICCKGVCNGQPRNVPPPVDGWTQVMYNVDADPFDSHPLENKTLAAELRALLPASFGCGTSYAGADELIVSQRLNPLPNE